MFDSECTSTLSAIDNKLAKTLVGIQRGVEKEGLRVLHDARIAQTLHSPALGSTLTHPSITTDYSEGLLEFITPKLDGVEQTVDFLSDLHCFTLANIGDEVIWPASMPCKLDGDASIPIAEYGTSNVGTLKHVYRQGLGVRYGRIMQSIAGIHYNFSLPDTFWSEYQKKLSIDKFTNDQTQASADQESLQDFKSAHYFSLIRNFRRYSWLLHYLFGASPVLDKSFLDGREHALQAFSEQTYGLPYATSLRMSDLGYQNSAQEELHVSYASLDEYVTTLAEAMQEPYAAYEALGVKKGNAYQQLNTNVLQIENEYYSDIRPKRVTCSGEKPIAALRERGVEYIEVRILDINPFLAEGLNAEQIRFMDAFLMYCLCSQCPNQSDTGCPEIKNNQRDVIMRGRDPELNVLRDNQKVPFATAATELLSALLETASILDAAHGGNDYVNAVNAQKAKVMDPSLTPSGIMMNMVHAGADFIDIAKEQADLHKESFKQKSCDAELIVKMSNLAEQSIAEQQQIEKADTLSFEDYLASYNQD